MHVVDFMHCEICFFMLSNVMLIGSSDMYVKGLLPICLDQPIIHLAIYL